MIRNALARLLAIVLVCAAWHAEAHDVWADGSSVPAWVKSACCGPQDVHVIDPDDVSGPDAKGYYHVREVGTPVPSDRVYDSLDGVTYVFYNPYSQPKDRYVYCLFLSRGF